jgi:hypothetical protein
VFFDRAAETFGAAFAVEGSGGPPAGLMVERNRSIIAPGPHGTTNDAL